MRLKHKAREEIRQSSGKREKRDSKKKVNMKYAQGGYGKSWWVKREKELLPDTVAENNSQQRRKGEKKKGKFSKRELQ